MDVGTALSVAQTLFAALQCSELKEICSFCGKDSQLDEFQNTVDTVKAVLLDAQNKDNISDHKTQLYIQRLKDAVYDADDLLDEFVTLAEQKEHMKDGKVSEKVRLFFSRINPFASAYKMSRGVKKIRKKLDAIASDHSKFGFSVDSQPIRRRREETCSYVYENDIVGREDDVETIVGFLLDSNMKENVSFLTIVGVGGLGKTALAQLVYNDARVTSAVSLKLWTCVSDNEDEELAVQVVLSKILASAVGKKDEESTMDLVQRQLREKLASNRYLLVLDDVWTENRNQWLKLIEFLRGGQKGSWIVVTTRSHETSQIVGGVMKHELQGLSKEDSRLLFEKTAFGSGQSNVDDDLVEIGRGIVEQCAGVPLAIRVAGSLLYGQDKTKWLSFQKIGLSNISDSQKDIMPILKLSYDQLEPSLKCCFSYCALFPKDHEIKKELLVSLWMAQGFIVPLDEGQRVEDAAQDYFSILLRRCFFQDIEHDVFGEIESCKIHDLMHDIAQKVAGKEICVKTDVVNNMDKKVRHLGLVRGESVQHLFTKSHIRSFLFVDNQSFRPTKLQNQFMKALIANWGCLRALDLTGFGMITLPDSIGGLLHLRFLDVSGNAELEVLPESFIKLYNLETLILSYCQRLKELPVELNKLVKLRTLELFGCVSLTHMPRGMGRLTCLHTLRRFVVKSLSWKHLYDELEELKCLKNLKGELEIEISIPCNDREIKEGDIREGAFLRNNQLNRINLWFKEAKVGQEALILSLMEKLQPPSTLKTLTLSGIGAVRMPSWARGSNLNTFFPNLTDLHLSQLSIEHVTWLENLPQLKILELRQLSELKYLIDYSAEGLPRASTPAGLPTAEGSLLFPSLKILFLEDLPKLEGWRRSRMGVEDQLLCDSSSNMEPLRLPQLKDLWIRSSPNLECILLCPVLDTLTLYNFNKSLQIRTGLSKELGDEKAEATSSTTLSSFDIPKLREIDIDDVKWLNSLPLEAFKCLNTFKIWSDKEVESLEEIGEVMSRMISLREIEIVVCSNLRSVVGALHHLSSLEKLEIWHCPNLSLIEEEREHGIDIAMPFSHSLRSLTLQGLSLLVDLPNWMQFLSALQFLEISNCRVESLPKWMPQLTSLRKLQLEYCSPSLKERCGKSTGEDWPLIKHIPSINFD